jgi:hypothetical protein
MLVNISVRTAMVDMHTSELYSNSLQLHRYRTATPVHTLPKPASRFVAIFRTHVTFEGKLLDHHTVDIDSDAVTPPQPMRVGPDANGQQPIYVVKAPDAEGDTHASLSRCLKTIDEHISHLLVLDVVYPTSGEMLSLPPRLRELHLTLMPDDGELRAVMVMHLTFCTELSSLDIAFQEWNGEHVHMQLVAIQLLADLPCLIPLTFDLLVEDERFFTELRRLPRRFPSSHTRSAAWCCG